MQDVGPKMVFSATVLQSAMCEGTKVNVVRGYVASWPLELVLLAWLRKVGMLMLNSKR